MSQIRVLLVDDSDDFLDVVSEWLTADPGIAIVGTARTGCEAVARVEELKPDVVLMDVTMPGMNGFEATRSIKSKPDSPLVVLLAFHDSETARHAAWAAGADDLMAKANVTAGLLTLVRDLVAGRQHEAVLTKVGELRAAGHAIEVIDVGGGFASPRDPHNKEMPRSEFVTTALAYPFLVGLRALGEKAYHRLLAKILDALTDSVVDDVQRSELHRQLARERRRRRRPSRRRSTPRRADRSASPVPGRRAPRSRSRARWARWLRRAAVKHCPRKFSTKLSHVSSARMVNGRA